MAAWKWNKKRHLAAEMLARGYIVKEVSAAIGTGERSIYRWRSDSAFKAEEDLLAVTIGIASKAERLKIINKAVRQSITAGTGKLKTEKDVLDWLKLAQSETNQSGQVTNINIPNIQETIERIFGETKPE